MLLFIESYPYELNYKIREDLTVKDALSGVVSYFNKKETTYKPEYVGYCYSKVANDVILFLPKVVLTGEQNEEKIGKNWNGQTGSIEPYLSSVGAIHSLGIAVVKDAIEIQIVIAHEDGIDDLLARDVLNLSAREVETVGKNR